MITLLPYNPTWRDEFVRIGVPIRQALGGLALRIDHIGSTAVLGLAAKDIIDVQIAVRSLAPAVEEALRQAGYARVTHITQDHVPPGGVTESAEWAKWWLGLLIAEAAEREEPTLGPFGTHPATPCRPSRNGKVDGWWTVCLATLVGGFLKSLFLDVKTQQISSRSPSRFGRVDTEWRGGFRKLARWVPKGSGVGSSRCSAANRPYLGSKRGGHHDTKPCF